MDHYTALTVTHAIHAPASVYIDHAESTFRHGIVRCLLGAGELFTWSAPGDTIVITNLLLEPGTMAGHCQVWPG